MVGLSFFEVEQLPVPHLYINFRILFRKFVKMYFYISLNSLILLLLWIICTMPDLFHIYVCNHVPWHPWKYSLNDFIIFLFPQNSDNTDSFHGVQDTISNFHKMLILSNWPPPYELQLSSWKYHQRRTLARAFARNMTRKKEGKMRKCKIARKFHKTTYLIFVAALILMFLRRTFIFQHNNFILLKQEMQQKNSSKLFATTWRCYLMLLWPVLRYL